MYLKSSVFFSKFMIDPSYVNNISIDMLIASLTYGQYCGSRHHIILNNLRHGSYNKKSYESLPKAVKRMISEYNFEQLGFKYDDFYDYNEDTNVIYKEYCEMFLRLYPNAKKIKLFYNKLKTTHPEIFI